MIDDTRLRELLRGADPALSLYFPLAPEQRDVRGPEARLRALTEAADAALLRHGAAAGARAAMLAPAREAARLQDFAHHRDYGFVLFASPQRADLFSLPHALPELLVVGRQFHLKPLLPALAQNRRFNVLALSQGQARLYSATPFAWQELPLDDLPPRVEAAAREMESAEAPTGRGQSPQTADGAPDEQRGELLTQTLRNVAHAVRRALAADDAPLVLAANSPLASQFRGIAHLPQLQDQGLAVNPFGISERDLHARAVALMRPMLEAPAEAVLEQVRARLGTADNHVGIRPEEILAAAREGRVEAIVVALDEALWGSCDKTPIVHGHQTDAEDDLLNEAAVAALRAGGRAYALPIELLPRRSPAVATYRF